ncbi:very short patch repair endonuclease [Lolliginicoccus lacisalsi]
MADFLTPAERSERMARIRGKDTGPELALRRALFAEGLRYRVRYRPFPENRRMSVDVAFTRLRIAVEVRGCYWHGCPDHYRQASSNVTYWSGKIAGNVARDERKERLLEERGWSLIVVWEHERLGDAVERVLGAVREARGAVES